ncbi:polar amino acid transport system substrate-binding protein [Anaerovirgula multivorans]|uniref:histidine kinase n=1 Tax=Anaerovirgula multivorans TaxID=312168 RepID=A0A239F2W9_9FIRM|nr:transporter substrate-binding domain-containing protein [Anaerovirgula multivorans]SNS50623.1 polar amino acid transport system substrate-binding protein [Anaerovirgula multivorans]
MKKTIAFVTTLIIIAYGVLAYFEVFNTITFFGETDSITLRIAGDRNFPPYEYIDEHGEYIGFNVDIIRAIALSTGINVQFYPMEWQETSEKLQAKEVDVIQGIKITKEREKYYDFSDAYLENSQSIFVLMDTEIEKLEDLSFQRVAIQQGDVAITNLKALWEVKIIFTSDQEEAMRKLLVGEVDAYIGNTLTGAFLINQLGVRNQVKIVGEMLNPSKYAVAVARGDVYTQHIINKGLKEIKRNGTYDKIYRKWFGQPLQFPSWYKRKIIATIGIAISSLLIMILFLYRWNSSLKKEVEKQTYEIQEVNKILIGQNKEISREKDFREKILQNIFIAVVTINKEGRISFVNQLAYQLLGSQEEGRLVGNPYRETLLEQLFSLDKLQEGKGEEEIYIQGEKRLLYYDIRTITNINGDMEEVILFFRDVTEERKLQETIRTKDKLQSLGNLVASIAHEIRNPLTSIKAYAELLPKKFNNTEFQKLFSTDIPLEIDRVNTLINDLLEYAKPRKPFRERIHLQSALNGVLTLLKNKIKQEKVHIENHIDEAIYIHMDKNHLRQVLLNMILNAIESMDKEKKKITFSAEIRDKKILLNIKDNGCGIDEDSIHKIYNPFYTTKSNGTGLGLFVTFQLLAENGVALSYESALQEGTIFTLTFTREGEDFIAEAINC